mmetsp:Transcript_24304/g.45632  ORF Transcript_24304/g.45632 Transcript_24304/m.45632 type:complete len:220 (+) Transcript_24304:641-1300(+)
MEEEVSLSSLISALMPSTVVSLSALASVNSCSNLATAVSYFSFNDALAPLTLSNSDLSDARSAAEEALDCLRSSFKPLTSCSCLALTSRSCSVLDVSRASRDFLVVSSSPCRDSILLSLSAVPAARVALSSTIWSFKLFSDSSTLDLSTRRCSSAASLLCSAFFFCASISACSDSILLLLSATSAARLALTVANSELRPLTSDSSPCTIFSLAALSSLI